MRAGVVNAARWVRERGFENVLLEIANEYPHQGFAHALIRDPKSSGRAHPAGAANSARACSCPPAATATGASTRKWPRRLISCCRIGTARRRSKSLRASRSLKKFGKPIVANEDDKTGADAVAALRVSVENGASYGLMLEQHNQRFPFHFDGAADDPVFYAELQEADDALERNQRPRCTRAIISRRPSRRVAGAGSSRPRRFDGVGGNGSREARRACGSGC